MKHREAITIGGDAAAVWAFVGNPEQWPAFHDKIEVVECAHPGHGAAVELLLHFGKHDVLCQGQLGEYKANERLHAEFAGRSTGQIKNEKPITFRVTYSLTAKSAGMRTRVVERVEYDVKIPWLFRGLVWLIEKFGKPMGQTNLQKLKELVENSGGGF